ncbi:MAG: class I SAM-dependent methyltransferase [Acidobacteriota bacterium]|nr:class I SAM-dependent methyltransferase [Acidobacteriota bacterium]
MNAATRRKFLEEYAAVRRAEGRGSPDREWYAALPYRDLTGRNSDQWAIRARSFRYFCSRILPKLEARPGIPLRILDLGAGNGWMSYRLSQLGHWAVAVDIFADPLDGLSAIRNYDRPFPAALAEFNALPFAGGAFDIAIFNSSFHYSEDYARTLREVRRCLRPAGQVFVIDSPVYRKAEHGERMREERHRNFEIAYGFRSDALGSVEYLDEDRLAELSHEVGVQWSRWRPWYGVRWAMRPLRAFLRRKRPPSRFEILGGRFRVL